MAATKPVAPAEPAPPPVSLARRLAAREDARRELHRTAAERLTQRRAA
jgi:hypothetical protein